MSLVLAAGLALLASAVLDRPETTVTASATVPGTEAEVWRELVDLAAYDEWNPVFRNVSGSTALGGKMQLDLVIPGRAREGLEPTVVVSRPGRKLWWRHRTLAPGLRDWEYEAILTPLEDGNVLVVQQLRVEGLLAPLEDAGEVQEALDLVAEAFRDRLERSGESEPG